MSSALLGVGVGLLVSGHLIGLVLTVVSPLPAAWFVRAGEAPPVAATRYF